MGSALNFAEMKLIFLVLVTLVVTVPEATGTPHLLYDLCNRVVAHCHTNSCSGSGSGSGSAQPQPAAVRTQLYGYQKREAVARALCKRHVLDQESSNILE